MNGDILTTLDYAELMRFHEEHGGGADDRDRTTRTSALALGVIEGDGGVVTGYVEKPTLHYEVSMGDLRLRPSALSSTCPSGHFDFPELVLALLAAGETVTKPTASTAPWFDIGTPHEHERAVAAFEANPSLFDSGEAAPG